jgi:hypothetical protein
MRTGKAYDIACHFPPSSTQNSTFNHYIQSIHLRNLTVTLPPLTKMSESPRHASRDDIVAAVTSFYDFLTTFPYLPPSAIETPPPEGWPESDRAVLRKLGKTDFVVELLSHLPYICDRAWHVGYDTQPLHYIGDDLKRYMDWGFSMERALLHPWNEKIPENVIALTYGENYGSWLLLDTEKGIHSR